MFPVLWSIDIGGFAARIQTQVTEPLVGYHGLKQSSISRVQ
jgi:hypothetical protein